MKSTFKILLLLLIIFNFQSSSMAQEKKAIKLDQNAIVKNTEGQEYPYAVWYKLFQSGKYGMKLIDAKDSERPIFTIYEMSEQEIEARNERMPKPLDSGAFKEGDEFKYFSFRDTNNQKFKIEDLKGKVLVINYWFINCPPCRQEIPELNKLVEKFKDQPDVLFIAIGLDEWYQLKEFLESTPFNYHFITSGKEYAKDVGITGYPTNIVVDKKGKIVFQSKGGSFANPLWIERYVNKALKE